MKDQTMRNSNHPQLKRLKLHRLIEKLRNEETNLVLLNKLRLNQKLIQHRNRNSQVLTNNLHSKSIHNQSSEQKLQISSISKQIVPNVTQKTSNSVSINKSQLNKSFEEHRSQAKSALRQRLERDLLSIPRPKSILHDILFIPNGTSLEFQTYIGQEDVIQCLNEVQNIRQRLPERFSDHAHINEPYICAQCGTDFTIRWWKHANTKLSSQSMEILCDRCKKRITRQKLKSDHSGLLKNVFLKAMQQEKEIDKHFNSMIKQQVNSSLDNLLINASELSATRKPALMTNQSHDIINNQKLYSKNISKRSPQQNIKHPNTIHSTVDQYHKISMPIRQQASQQFISPFLSQKKSNKTVKMAKQQQTTVGRSHLMTFLPNFDLINALVSSDFTRPTGPKRSGVPIIEMK